MYGRPLAGSVCHKEHAYYAFKPSFGNWKTKPNLSDSRHRYTHTCRGGERWKRGGEM